MFGPSIAVDHRGSRKKDTRQPSRVRADCRKTKAKYRHATGRKSMSEACHRLVLGVGLAGIMDVSFDLLLNAIISGLLLGGFYAALSVCVAVAFGMLDVLNLAHPAFLPL